MTNGEKIKNDLGVDREDAVERLNALKQLIGYDKDSEIVKATQKSLDMAIKALEQEPRKGHWVERNPKNSKTCRLIECSECGEGYIVGYNVPFEQWIDGRNYCVHCGCKMVKENEDAVN